MNTTMKTTMLKGLLATVCALAGLQSASAHYLWIERQGQEATVYFGEFEESARERSPGRLDEMPSPQAQVLSASGAKHVALQKRSHGFAFSSAGGGQQALIVEEGAVGVKDWTAAGIGIVKPFFYARHQSLNGADAAPSPLLTLDIVPTRDEGVFQVFFRGKPLPKADVKIVAPNTWAQEGKTAADGLVRLPMPWKGQYILQVVHLEKGSDTYEGKAYQAKRHRATLTVVSPRGQ